MRLKSILFVCWLLMGLILSVSCGNDKNEPSPDPVDPETNEFVKGADVSWVTEMEENGYKFYSSTGAQTDLFALLKSYGIGAIRLRVWVNPENGWNNIDDVLAKAKRANSCGMKIMIDFHYSDSWADPSQQVPPKAWTSYNISQMCDAVKNHTSEMMQKLKASNITPTWVQVGNETRGGMLYPLGTIDNGSNYALLTNAGYDAVKAVFGDCKVIVHIDSGQDLDLFTYVFDYMKMNGAEYDIIGMSLYPDTSNWQQMANQCVSNINTLYARYGKPVMICEVGMSWDQASITKSFLLSLISKSKVETNNKCLGIFYWEPESEPSRNGGYTKGCFSNGKPTIALDAFKE